MMGFAHSSHLPIILRVAARFEIDADHLNSYVSSMKRTLGDYVLIGLLVLIMCTTAAGIGIRVYQAFGG